jgi:hypothetical protein
MGSTGIAMCTTRDRIFFFFLTQTHTHTKFLFISPSPQTLIVKVGGASLGVYGGLLSIWSSGEGWEASG